MRMTTAEQDSLLPGVDSPPEMSTKTPITGKKATRKSPNETTQTAARKDIGHKNQW